MKYQDKRKGPNLTFLVSLADMKPCTSSMAGRHSLSPQASSHSSMSSLTWPENSWPTASTSEVKPMTMNERLQEVNIVLLTFLPFSSWKFSLFTVQFNYWAKSKASHSLIKGIVNAWFSLQVIGNANSAACFDFGKCRPLRDVWFPNFPVIVHSCRFYRSAQVPLGLSSQDVLRLIWNYAFF